MLKCNAINYVRNWRAEIVGQYSFCRRTKYNQRHRLLHLLHRESKNTLSSFFYCHNYQHGFFKIFVIGSSLAHNFVHKSKIKQIFHKHTSYCCFYHNQRHCIWKSKLSFFRQHIKTCILWQSDIYILQGSVATRFRCGKIFNDDYYIANFLTRGVDTTQ